MNTYECNHPEHGTQCPERPHAVGDRAWIYSYGNWYRGVIAKLGPKQVTIQYTNKSGYTRTITHSQQDARVLLGTDWLCPRRRPVEIDGRWVERGSDEHKALEAAQSDRYRRLRERPLNTDERDRLREMREARGGRINVCPSDVAYLLDLGLVAYAGESITGRTYFRITSAGRKA